MKEKEESRRKKKVPNSPLTSKSHGNARSPAPAPSNQIHTLSQVCFNTLHAHNHVASNSAVNNWLSFLPLMALLQVCLCFFFFSFRALILSFDDHTFNKNRFLKNACACRWHAPDEFLGHHNIRGKLIQCKIVQQIKSVYTNTAPKILAHDIMRL